MTAEVPLGESAERYLIEVRDGTGNVRRTDEVPSPAWTYSVAEQSADGIAGPFSIDVAQISDRFGPGLSRRIVIHE
jgi:hypothetical protein